MADIFDLARSINAQKQQSSQGYGSALEDLPMQVMEMMDTRAKEKRVSLKNDSVLLSNLIKGATTEEEMDNVRQLSSKYAKDSYQHDETKLYGEAINQQFQSKQAAYNQFKSSAEWLDNQINTKTSEMNVADSVFKFENSDRAIRHNNQGAHIWTPNVEEKYGATKGDSFVGSDGKTYYTAKYDSKEKGDKASRDIINNIWKSSGGDVDKFVRTYTGSDDEEVIANYKKEIESSKAKGGSYFKMSSQEMQNLTLDEIEERIREFESISGGFEAGQQFGFKYNKGNSSYVTLQNEYADYKQRLDDTMKAHVTGGKISGEEAMAIMLGDFDKTKTQAIRQTNANIDQGLKEYNALLALQRKNLTENDEDIWVGALGEETRGMSVDAVQKYINQKLPATLNSISNSKERLRLWTGLDPDGGLADLNKNTEAGDGGKTEPPAVFGEIAEDKEELPIGIARFKTIKDIIPNFDKSDASKPSKPAPISLGKNTSEDEKIESYYQWDGHREEQIALYDDLKSKKNTLDKRKKEGYGINEGEYDDIIKNMTEIDNKIKEANANNEKITGEDLNIWEKRKKMSKRAEIADRKKRIRTMAVKILKDKGLPHTKENFEKAQIEAMGLIPSDAKEYGDIWGTKTHSQRVPGARTPAYRTGSRAARP